MAVTAAARHEPPPDDQQGASESGYARGFAWQWLETRHLVTACAIASERSFRAAAQRLGYTQSAVSQQIAVLERQIGARLFDRSPAGVAAPTPAGETLIRHAEEILARLRLARAELEGDVGATGATATRIVTAPGPAAVISAEIVARLSRVNDVRVMWSTVDSSRSVFDAVASGRAEFGVGDVSECDEPTLTSVAAAAFPLHFVWDGRVCDVGRFDPSVLHGRAVAGYRSCPSTTEALRALRWARIEPDPLVRSDDVAVITTLIDHGAFALAPAALVGARSLRTSVVAGAPPAQVAVVKHRERPTRPEATQVIHAVLERGVSSGSRR